MKTSDDMNNERKPVGLGPGERLQVARIEQGLSLRDVADRMHLSAGILESIEENNFDEITAPIFAKGYLRAYARIVGLNEDEMIQQYINYYSEADPPITSTSSMAPELSVADARIRWTTYLVILVVAALPAAWWWTKEQNRQTAISLDAQPSSTVQSLATSEQVAGSEVEAVSESSIENTGSSEMTSVETPQNLASESIETLTLEVDESREKETGDGEIQVDEAASALVVSESEAVVAVLADGSVGTRMAPTGSDKLKIIVHADTWADIKDGTAYQLIYDLLRAGQVMELTGQAPFAVFFGNGHGVEVRFNDQEISLTSLIQDDNTARLNVGQ